MLLTSKSNRSLEFEISNLELGVQNSKWRIVICVLIPIWPSAILTFWLLLASLAVAIGCSTCVYIIPSFAPKFDDCCCCSWTRNLPTRTSSDSKRKLCWLQSSIPADLCPRTTTRTKTTKDRENKLIQLSSLCFAWAKSNSIQLN